MEVSLFNHRTAFMHLAAVVLLLPLTANVVDRP